MCSRDSPLDRGERCEKVTVQQVAVRYDTAKHDPLSKHNPPCNVWYNEILSTEAADAGEESSYHMRI